MFRVRLKMKMWVCDGDDYGLGFDDDEDEGLLWCFGVWNMKR